MVNSRSKEAPPISNERGPFLGDCSDMCRTCHNKETQMDSPNGCDRFQQSIRGIRTRAQKQSISSASSPCSPHRPADDQGFFEPGVHRGGSPGTHRAASLKPRKAHRGSRCPPCPPPRRVGRVPRLQVLKNTSQTPPRITIARTRLTASNRRTLGPGSACRASVGVSTVLPFSDFAIDYPDTS